MNNFKTTISTLVLAALPAFAFAAGDHGAHGAKPEAAATKDGHGRHAQGRPRVDGRHGR